MAGTARKLTFKNVKTNPTPKESPKAGQGAGKVPTVVKDLGELNSVLSTLEPPKPPKLQMSGRPIIPVSKRVETGTTRATGFVVMHRFGEDEKVIFSKVTGKFNGIAQTILLHRPTIVFPIGAEIAFDLEKYEDRLTAVNPELVEAKNDIQNLLEYIVDPDVIEDSRIGEIYFTTMVEEWIRHNHSGETPDKRTENFLKVLGIHSIVGVIGAKIIYKAI